AFDKKEATWSAPYILFTGQDMAIAASRPIYDDQQNLLGVVSVDIFLSQISNFLSTLDVPAAAQSFSIDRYGMLIAASTQEKLFTDKNGNGNLERVYARDSKTEVIRQSAIFLTKTFGDYRNIPHEEQQFELVVNGERQFLQLVSVQNQYGID